jgi:DNA polymerase-3 subunit delta
MFGAPSSNEKKPRFYMFFGNDELAMHKLVQGLVEKVMESTMGDMNVTRFQENPRVDEVREAAYVMPLFSDRRLVVVANALEWVKGSRNKEAIIQLLQGLPASTALVIQLNLEVERGGWKDFSATHWLRKWILEQPAHFAFQKECVIPAIGQIPHLIMREAAEKKGEFTFEAAQELVRAIGNDMMVINLEIEKLLTYVNFERPVTAEDVRLLSPDIAPISVFDMVDAIGERNIPKAAQLLHRLLETELAIPLFGMIIRQFRLLIQVRDILNRGGNKMLIEKSLKLHPFVAEKMEKQTALFTMQQLTEIYHRLLIADENMKTGIMEPKLAIEMFVSEMAIV